MLNLSAGTTMLRAATARMYSTAAKVSALEGIGHVVEPASGVVNASVVCLPGLGDPGDGFVSLFEHLNMKETRVVVARPPDRAITINMGMVMPGWYDIFSLDRSGEMDESGIATSAAHISEIVDSEVSAHDGDAGKVMLFGFSQGAAMASYVGLGYPSKLAHMLCISGYCIPSVKISDANKKAHITALHGDMDPMVPIAWAEGSWEELKEKSEVRVDWHVAENTGHEIAQEHLALIANVMREHLGEAATLQLRANL